MLAASTLRQRAVATVILGLMVAPIFSTFAAASPAPAPAAPAGPVLAPAAPALLHELVVADPGLTLDPADVAARAAATPSPSGPETPNSAPAVDVGEAGQSRVPLLDTDNQSILEARWINSTDSQFLGESIDGARLGPPFRRTDIDWWRFHLTFTPASAGKIDFNIQKDTWDAVEVYVYSFPDAEVLGDSRLSQYVLMNASQDMGTATHISLTAFEDTTYYMLLQTIHSVPGCCRVNYTITNIAYSTVAPADDNNNVSRSEAYNPASPPTNRDVEQNTDLYDVFDLTAQFTIDGSKDDYAYVMLNATVNQGRNGTTDWFNGSSNAAEDSDTVSVMSMYLMYVDKSSYWHVFPTSATPGNIAHIETLINGTPVYAVFTVSSAVVASGGASSVPGWVRYSITGLFIQEDHSPTLTTNIPTQTMNEDDAASGFHLINLESYFSDDFDDGVLHFNLIYQQSSSVTIDINGSWLSVIPTTPDYTGSFQLRVVAHDFGRDRIASPDDHTTPSNYFTVIVQPVNDVPRVSTFGGAAPVNGTLSFVLAQGDVRSYSAAAQDPDDAAFTWTITPALNFSTFDTSTGQLVLSPRNENVGNYTLVLKVFDAALANSSVTLNFRVDNRNDPPAFVSVSNTTVAQLPSTTFQATEGVLFTFKLQIADPDWDIPSGSIHDNFNYVCDKQFVTVTRDPSDGRIAWASFTPTNSQVGAMTVVFSVGDGQAGIFQSNVSVKLNINNVNQPPTFTQVGTTTGTIQLQGSKTLAFTGLDGAIQGHEFGVNVRASDIDVEAQVGDSLTFSTNLPGKFQVTPHADGLSADIAFTPNSTDAKTGRVVVIVYVNDVATSDQLTLTIDVTNVNDPPVLEAVALLELTQGVPFVYTFNATDPDGDPVEFQTDSQIFVVDSSGTVEINPTNELIQGRDLSMDVLVTARDNHAGIATMTVHVIIHNVNDAPTTLAVASPEDASVHPAGESIALSGTAHDIDDGDEAHLTYSWYFDDTLVGEGKTITAVLTNDNATARTIVVRMQVEDAHHGSSNKTVTITVNGQPPKSPGFEGPDALAGLAAAAAVAAVAAARRRRRTF